MNKYAADLWARSKEALKTAEADLSVSADAAASRAYYAAFYAVSALFARSGSELEKKLSQAAKAFAPVGGEQLFFP